MLAGRAAETVGDMPEQGVAGKGWAEDKHLAGLTGGDPHAS